MDYLPIVGDAKAVFDIEANIVVKDNSGNKTINHKFASVPVQENYRTNIVGNLISSTTDFNVSIDSEFDGTYEGNFDGLINKSAIKFDSRSITFKKPFGAIKEESEDLTLLGKKTDSCKKLSPNFQRGLSFMPNIRGVNKPSTLRVSAKTCGQDVSSRYFL